MKVLVKFVGGLDRIQDVQEWTKDAGYFVTARPDAGGMYQGLVRVQFIGEWRRDGDRDIPVFAEESLLENDAG